jgi:hypothetical protein
MPILRKPKPMTNATHPGPAKVPQRPRASEFKVPSPSELLPELAKLDAQTLSISESVRSDRAEIKLLEREIAVDDTPELHPEVAKLLDGEPSPKAAKRQAIKELRHQIAVAEAAMTEIAKRRTAAATGAGRAVCQAVRPEAERLVANLVAALQEVDTAHQELGDLLLAVEAEGVSTGGLGPVKPYFLSDHREADRKIVTYIRDVKGAGYAV